MFAQVSETTIYTEKSYLFIKGLGFLRAGEQDLIRGKHSVTEINKDIKIFIFFLWGLPTL